MRSAERGLSAQAALLAGLAGAGAALSSTLDRADLAPQESLGISYMPIYLAILIALSAALAYYVVRHFRSLRGFLDAYTAAAAFVSALSICSYSYACQGAIPGILVAAAAAAAVALGLRRGARSASYAAAGVLVGVLMAEFIPFSWTPYFLLAFAAYDAFAVSRGPLRSIPRDMDVLMLDLGSVRVGLGDVAFYSFAASSLELSRGPLWASLGVLAIGLGAAATLLLLRRLRRPMPGLTIPLAACAALLLIRPP